LLLVQEFLGVICVVLGCPLEFLLGLFGVVKLGMNGAFDQPELVGVFFRDCLKHIFKLFKCLLVSLGENVAKDLIERELMDVERAQTNV